MKVTELTGAELDYLVAQHDPRCVDLSYERRDGHIVGMADINGVREVCIFMHDGNALQTIRYRRMYDVASHYNPSASWLDGGPIIERENIQLGPPTQQVHRNGGPNAGWGPSGLWSACTWHKGANGRRSIAHHESSPLIAAMRCYVASMFGDEAASTTAEGKGASDE